MKISDDAKIAWSMFAIGVLGGFVLAVAFLT